MQMEIRPNAMKIHNVYQIPALELKDSLSELISFILYFTNHNQFQAPPPLTYYQYQIVMSSNSNPHHDLQPLLRTKTHVLSICQSLPLELLQARLLNHYPMSSNITHLNISSNRISEIPRIPFKNLAHLNVSRCFLNDDCTIELEQLTRLDLSHNCLTKLPQIKSWRLKFLNLSFNHLEILEDKLLKYEQLQELRCSGNHLNLFNINVLRMPACKNTDIVKIIDLRQLEGIKTGTYSARYLIERSYPTVVQQLLRNLLVESIKRQYQVGIMILCQGVKQKQQLCYIQYCEGNSLNRSLETLLLMFKVTEGYDTCRIQSLNPQLFNYGNVLNLGTLIYTLEQNVEKNFEKCENFIKHLVDIGQPIVTEDTIMEIISGGNPKVVHLLFQYQIPALTAMEQKYQNPHLIKCLLQLDHPQLLLLLLDIEAFRKKLETFLMTSAICSLLGPKYKSYKYLLKLQKQFVKHQISKKICLFREYECMPTTNIYTTTPMYNCNENQLMTSYYQMQDPEPAPAQVIVKMNTEKQQKQNQPTVTQQVDKIRHSFSTKNRKLGLTLRKIHDN